MATFKFMGGFEKYINGNNTIIINTNITIKKMLNKKGIPLKSVSLILANNKRVSLSYETKKDDLVKIYSYIGGG